MIKNKSNNTENNKPNNFTNNKPNNFTNNKPNNTVNSNTQDDAVRNLQIYLRQLAHSDSDITQVPVDGIYGSETRQSVMDFQKKNGLTQSGEVNKDTWDLIFNSYRESIAIQSPPQMISPFPRVPMDYSLKSGDSWFLVDVVQFMLEELTVSYDNLGSVSRTGIYDESTAFAVRQFQSLNYLTETGEVDRLTWNSLAKQYNIASKAYKQ